MLAVAERDEEGSVTIARLYTIPLRNVRPAITIRCGARTRTPNEIVHNAAFREALDEWSRDWPEEKK